MRQDARNRYPWAEWLNGKPQEHTTDNPKSFRNYLYEYAKRNDIYVTATIDGQVVRFQVFADFDSYTAGKRTPAGKVRNSAGQFLTRLDDPAVNRLCVVCGKRLTPQASENATECERIDFATGQTVQTHQES